MDNYLGAGSAQDRKELIGQFLSELKSLKLTGREFLALIGNTKISNESYNEIKTNPSLTHNRLVEIFISSPLSVQDFIKILNSARNYSEGKKRKEQEEALKRMVAVAEQRLAGGISSPQKKADENILDESFDISGKTIPIPDKISKSASAFETKTITLEPLKDTQEEYHKSNAEYNEYDSFEDNSGLKNSASDFDEYNVEAAAHQIDEYDEYNEGYPKTKYLPAQSFEEEENNNGKIILTGILAVIVIILSFFIRYSLTGSLWIIDNDKFIYDKPLNYKDLALRFSDMNSSLERDTFTFINDYYLPKETAKNNVLIQDSAGSCSNDKYLFKLYENKLYALETSKGLLKSRKIVTTKDSNVFKSIFLHNDRLFAVLEGEYIGNYIDSEPIEKKESNSDESMSIRKGTFTQPTITIMMFDANDFSEEPICEITSDGNLNDILINNSDIFLITDYQVKDSFAHNDLMAYIPHVNGNPIKLENIFIPLNKAYYSNMTVITMINRDGTTLSKAASGGKNSWCYLNPNGQELYIIQQEGEEKAGIAAKSRIVRYNLSSEPGAKNFIESGYFETDGIIYKGAFTQSGGIIRMVAVSSKSANLSIYDDSFKKLSAVSKIGINKPINVLFDNSYVYIVEDSISEGISGSEPESAYTLYVIDTTVSDKPLFAEEGFQMLYNDNFYYWSENLRLSFEPKTDDNNNLNSFYLGMFQIQSIGVTEEIASVAIKPEEGFVSMENTEKIYYFPQKNLVLIPICYFNGISRIEKFIIYIYNENVGFSKQGEIVYYDQNKKHRSAISAGDYVYSFWDEIMVSADILTGRVIREYKFA